MSADGHGDPLRWSVLRHRENAAAGIGAEQLLAPDLEPAATGRWRRRTRLRRKRVGVTDLARGPIRHLDPAVLAHQLEVARNARFLQLEGAPRRSDGEALGRFKMKVRMLNWLTVKPLPSSSALKIRETTRLSSRKRCARQVPAMRRASSARVRSTTGRLLMQLSCIYNSRKSS